MSAAENVSYTLHKKSIYFTKLIGSGFFGDVYQGYQTDSNGVNRFVAVKTFKSKDDPQMEMTFKDEAYRMLSLQHAHIIQLIGVCPEPPSWIVMELAKYGEMSKYLRANESILNMRMLVLYSYQIASAMTYLESKKFVHRDIAARNVLVFEADCVKLADFGLSRFVGDENVYFKKSTGKLPIKWMSPESIHYRIYTSSSDVWMFGVFMWEVFTLGAHPFDKVPNEIVIDGLERGVRLHSPAQCPSDIYNLMCHCWQYRPQDRPQFKTIEAKLQDALKSGGAMEDMSPIWYSAPKDHHLDYDIPPPKPPIYSYPRNSRSCDFNNNYQKHTTAPHESNPEGIDGPQPDRLNEIIEEQRRQSEEDAEWLRQMESTFVFNSENFQ